jgi:hypothetical protein
MSQFGLGTAHHLSLIQVLLELDQLRQVLPVVPGIETSGLLFR